MSAYDPHAWTEFAVAAAGAAAVLAGLVFVAVSINLDKVLEVRAFPAGPERPSSSFSAPSSPRCYS